MIPTLQEGWAILRSDTVTLPTDDMYDAMRSAPLGDDNRQEDPTTLALEALPRTYWAKRAILP